MSASSEIRLLGVPYDAGSSFLRGPALAPVKIRESLFSPASNLTNETCVDLEEIPFTDRGDLEDTRRSAITAAVAEHVADGARLLCLGGDHSITHPILRGHADSHSRLTVLQIDAHADLYDELGGRRHSHASPFARALEEGLVERLVQVGIRTLNRPQKEQAERFGVEIIDMIAWEDGRRPAFDGPIYLTLDLDGLDPAHAPGVSHPEPGGLTVREVVRLIQTLPVPILGADIVELNPLRDSQDHTARVAAKLVKELAVKMAASP